MSATNAEIAAFLRDFKGKLKIWDILFRDDRGKNSQTLLALELRPDERKKIIAGLKADNYSEGPLKDILNKGPDMWIFGRQVKQQEIFIKITMGAPGTSVICISFHIAEHTMRYPFKTE
ncbi:MAG: toxin [Chlorobium sp.]